MRNTLHLLTLVTMLLAVIGGSAGATDDPTLIGWWQFEEGSGNVITDSSGNDHDGTVLGMAEWGDGPPGAGGALNFKQTRGANCGDFDPTGGTGVFTLTFWCLWDGTTGTQHFFTKSNGWAANTMMFQVEVKGGDSNAARTDRFALACQGATQAILHEVPKNEWAHMALVFDGTDATGYLNGVDETGPQPTGIGAYIEGPVWIGVAYNDARVFQGFLDDMRLYNRPLSADEVKAMVPPKLKARDPNPANGDVTVVTPLLRWTAGDTALLHDVYLGTDPNLAADDLVQSRSPTTLYYHNPGVTPGTRYYWRVDETETDMTTVHVGDVWTFVAQPVTAYIPEPADGANDACPDPNVALSWWPGRGAMQHHLYFGDDFEAVAAGSPETDKGLLADSAYTTGPLDPLTVYSWRVDEIAITGETEVGPVWTFATCLAVDDFEGYTDDLDNGQAIFQTWIDGLENGTGSVAGYFESANGTFGETGILYDGSQSMPLDYNNVNPPYYSEVEREFPTAQDWTSDAIDTLVLHIRGRSANEAAPLYVGLVDSSNRTGSVSHPDPEAAKKATWTEWEVPLSEFADAGVNLFRIESLYLGLGGRNASAPGGIGLIYVDAIWLTRPGPSEANDSAAD